MQSVTETLFLCIEMSLIICLTFTLDSRPKENTEVTVGLVQPFYKKPHFWYALPFKSR